MYLELSFVAISGWLAGMFVNYLADVLPAKRNLARPFCMKCGATQDSVFYSIVLMPCAQCGKHRSFRSWIVSFGYAAISVWLWMNTPQNLGYPLAFFLLIYFGVVIVIDIEHHLILHMVSLVGVGLGGLAGHWLHGFWRTIIGGLVGFAIMYALYIMGNKIMSWIAERRNDQLDEEALGFGDVNLSGVIGLLLGWPGITTGLILAILIAGVVSLGFLLIRGLQGQYKRYMAVPYGPFLVLGAIILLYFRDTILRIYGN